MMRDAVADLVDALARLGLLEPLARELESRGALDPDARKAELREVVRAELEAAGVGGGGGAAGQKLLTVRQAATRAGVSPATVRGWLQGGKLKGRRAGNRWRIEAGELDAYLRAGGVGGDLDLERRAGSILALVRDATDER